MRRLLHRLARWLTAKTAPAALAGAAPPGPSFADAYGRRRALTPADLLAELKGAAWTCASINAAVCAAHPPRLYIATRPGERTPKCATKALPFALSERLRAAPHLLSHTRAAERIEEVLDHPLLTLLRQVNSVHNEFDLWELTTLYQEVLGSAYWYLSLGPLGVPQEIWPLPAQHVTPRRRPGGAGVVDEYAYRAGGREEVFPPAEVIHFRYPDPRDPYLGGLSPLRACFEQAALASEYAAFKAAKFANCALPDAVLSPDETLGEEERDRLEARWQQQFGRGGAGRVLVAEAGLRVQLLEHSMGDLAALADLRVTKEEIANAFHVPLAYLTTETNLANLQAARVQHTSLAVAPRLRRRDQKLNEQLVPLYDPGGRLFLASDDPVPADREAERRQQVADLRHGVLTVNEVRGRRGLPPVPWGDAPLSPTAR